MTTESGLITTRQNRTTGEVDVVRRIAHTEIVTADLITAEIRIANAIIVAGHWKDRISLTI